MKSANRCVLQRSICVMILTVTHANTGEVPPHKGAQRDPRTWQLAGNPCSWIGRDERSEAHASLRFFFCEYF